MAEALSYEAWVGSETVINGEQQGSSWDVCQLGTTFLPGVITIEDFEYGVDIDIQKKRKKEKCRIRDNGLAPCAFNIKVELRASQWAEWQRALPAIQPRREGAARTPMPIVHPLPNAYGVRDIYVHKIKTDPPSARRGMVITIKVAEWFEEEKDSDGAKKGSTVKNFPGQPYRRYNSYSFRGDSQKEANRLYQNSTQLPMSDANEVMARTFDPPRGG